jgi:hypothetical protein
MYLETLTARKGADNLCKTLIRAKYAVLRWPLAGGGELIFWC